MHLHLVHGRRVMLHKQTTNTPLGVSLAVHLTVGHTVPQGDTGSNDLSCCKPQFNSEIPPEVGHCWALVQSCTRSAPGPRSGQQHALWP